MRDYRFDFANGTTDLVETMSVRTGYVRYYECLSGGGVDQRIRVESMGGGWQCVLRPGQGFRLPAEETGGIVVTNLSGAAMAGTLKLGPRDWSFEDQRLVGEVSVIDGGRFRTLSGSVFGWRLSQAASVGNNNVAQIWNPAGSGLRVLVKSYSVQGGAMVCGFNNVSLGSAGGTIGNKLAGGASVPGGIVSNQSYNPTQNPSGFVTVNQIPSGVPILEPEPIVIPPGFGFVMVSDNQNVITVATAHFIVEPA